MLLEGLLQCYKSSSSFSLTWSLFITCFDCKCVIQRFLHIKKLSNWTIIMNPLPLFSVLVSNWIKNNCCSVMPVACDGGHEAVQSIDSSVLSLKNLTCVTPGQMAAIYFKCSLQLCLRQAFIESENYVTEGRFFLHNYFWGMCLSKILTAIIEEAAGKYLSGSMSKSYKMY